MALDTSLNGLRAAIVTSMWGRRVGFDQNDFIVGTKDTRLLVEGVSSAGSTMISTSSLNLSAYGISLVGATGASGTTGYVLGAPVPGVYKTIFCASTGYAVITTTAGTNYSSTGSAASTHTVCTMAGKGNALQLIGLTTSLWGVLPNQTVSSVTTGQISFS